MPPKVPWGHKNIIRIHHECPCKIEISHLRGWNFSKGQGKSEGEISLSYIARLMMDCFSPAFSKLLVRT